MLNKDGNRILRPRASLSQHILVQIIVAISIPFILLLIALITFAKPYIQDKLSIQHTTLARAVASQSRSHLENAASEMRLLASIISQDRFTNKSETDGLLDTAITNSDVLSSIILTNENGLIHNIGLAQTRRAIRDNFIGVDISRLPHIVSAKKAHLERWSNVFLSAIDGGITVALAIPIGSRILVGEIPLAKLAGNLSNVRTEQQFVVLFDSHGQLIAHPDQNKGTQQINLRHLPIVNAALKNHNDMTDTFTMNEQQYLGSVIKMQGLNWYAMVAAPLNAIYEPIKLAGWALLAGILIAMLSAIILSLFSARRTATTVASYVNTAKNIASGNYTLNLPDSSVAEFNDLGRHLRAMSLSIESREIDLRGSERQFRAFYDAGLVGLALIDLNGCWLRVNDSLSKLTQYPEDELIGQKMSRKTHADDAQNELQLFNEIVSGSSNGYKLEKRLIRRDGTILWVQAVSRVVLNEEGRPDYITLLVQDISERKEAEERIELLAFYDPLTNLPNRRLFQNQLHHAMELGARTNSYAAVLFLDLDRFKDLNDVAGHAIGDRLLIQVARRLKGRLREADTIARLGGDEYIVMLEEIGDNLDLATRHCESAAGQLMTVFEQPFDLEGREYFCTASLGICLFHGNKTSQDEILKRADSAMYQAKNAGRSMIRFYDPELQADVEARSYLIGELRQALSRQELEIYLQPIVDDKQHLQGAEVLLRWIHPHKGFIPPNIFIPLAEETGLIEPIGNWVLEQSSKLLSDWSTNKKLSHLYLSINVSPYQFRRQHFVTEVRSIIETASAPTNKMVFELTETVLLDDIDITCEKMNALKNTGISFSLDDFGTGYSSLEYLKKLPFDQLKIDRSFVSDIGLDVTTTKIVNATLAMGLLLDMTMVAEGVETREQFEYLTQYKCQKYQGYYFGKPVPVEAFINTPAPDSKIIRFEDYSKKS